MSDQMLYGEKTIKIGRWKQPADRQRRCHTYYAADYEVVDIHEQEADANLIFIGGYTVPMPYWLMVTLNATRVEGKTYSGFGGVNFASNDLPPGDKQITLQMDRSAIRDGVESGHLILDPGREWLLDEVPWNNPAAPKTFSEVV